ncbi:MAG: hypothetical protein K2Y22_15885 [Candidatus Obscuribacterales bacterium]|nr:hypothetical protein [Candidatus Obscuribacterales bacterium]
MGQTQEKNIGLFDLDGSLANYDKAILAELDILRSPGDPELEYPRQADLYPHIKARVDLIAKVPN